MGFRVYIGFRELLVFWVVLKRVLLRVPFV